jgi:transcriptional regulator with XRE-family HTH domain
MLRNNHHSTRDIVAGNVRAELARRGVSQAKAAAHLGVSAIWLSRRLTGVVDMRISEVDAFAEFLGVPIEELLRQHPVAA